jgi:hypothetical protein
MDEDLDEMARDQLIVEVKKLREGIRQHRDNTEHDFVGITLHCGVCFRRKRTLFRLSRSGQSSFEGASNIGSRWTRKLLQLHEQTDPIKRHDCTGVHIDAKKHPPTIR